MYSLCNYIVISQQLTTTVNIWILYLKLNLTTETKWTNQKHLNRWKRCADKLSAYRRKTSWGGNVKLYLRHKVKLGAFYVFFPDRCCNTSIVFGLKFRTINELWTIITTREVVFDDYGLSVINYKNCINFSHGLCKLIL